MVNSSKKLILKSILLIIVVFLFIKLILFFTVPNTSYTKLLWKDIYKNSPFDVAIVGNSWVYCSANPKVFNSILGQNTIVLGSQDQKILDSYYTIKELYKTSNCKIVVLQINYEKLINLKGIRVSKTMIDYMKPSLNKAEYYFHAFPPDYWINALFPGLQMVDINSFKPSKMKEIAREKLFNPDLNIYSGNRAYQNNGFVIINRNRSFNTRRIGRIFPMIFPVEYIKSEVLQYYQKTIEFCKSQGSEVILASWPNFPYRIRQIRNYEKINKFITDFAIENNVEFLDFNYSKSNDFINNNDHYYDRLYHMNLDGANAFSTNLSKIILKIVNNEYNKEEYFYNSFDELAGSWNEVFGVWLERDKETNELKAVSVIPPNREVEYEFAIVMDSGEYNVYRPYNENPLAEAEKLPLGQYQIRVNARLIGSDEPFQQYNTIVY